jgi:hypothetical protein
MKICHYADFRVLQVSNGVYLFEAANAEFPALGTLFILDYDFALFGWL